MNKTLNLRPCLVRNNQTWKEMFTSSLKPQHISLSGNLCTVRQNRIQKSYLAESKSILQNKISSDICGQDARLLVYTVLGPN